MKMKSQRKAERDRAKRDEARHRTRAATEGETADTLDDLDDQVARSVLGYDE